MYSLCDGTRAVRTERVINGHKVIGKVVLDVKALELDNDGGAFIGAELPLASGVSWVWLWVSWRRELFGGGVGREREKAVF